MQLRILAALAACLFALSAAAQSGPPTRIRGVIEAVSGNTLTVKTREGPQVEIGLDEKLTVSTVKNVPLSSVDSNNFVGIATRTGADGKPEALEVLVFPEAMRGAGEGHYAWDLEPGSMMTNGTVSAAVQENTGRDLTVAYKGQSIAIRVPPEAPVVTFVPAQRAGLKPGERVLLSAVRNAEGHFVTGRVTVSKDGVAPPM